MIKNRYFWLRIQIIMTLIRKRKITLRKVANAAYCYLAYFLRLKKSAATPYVMNFELWNECNEACVFCRDAKGKIYDQNPETPDGVISKGKMPLELYYKIIDEVKSSLLMSIPYINGEPLIFHKLEDAIRYSTQRNVATMIASNGILLTKSRSQSLLEAGLDFIKVHVSGFTQEVHHIQHRRGNVESIKKNIRDLVEVNKTGKYGALVLIDYILYQHNQHELDKFRAFADELGVKFNVRPGNPKGMESSEKPQTNEPLPVDLACNWLWSAMSINWDGTMMPCCEYAVSSTRSPHGKFDMNGTSLKEVWNGNKAAAMRNIHTKTGRRNIEICSRCPRKGMAFKW